MREIERSFLRPAPLRSLWFSDLARVGLMTGVVKFAGAIKTAISARVFGLGDALDAYFVAFSICSFLCDSLAGSLSPALIPLFVRSEETGSRKELHACYGGTLYPSVIFLSTVGALVLICRGALLQLLAPGFSPEELSLTRSLMFVLAPMFPLMGINAVWRSLLNSQGLFVVVAIAPVMTPLLATGFLSFAHSLSGIYALALGSTVGVFAETLILAFYLWKLQIPVLPGWKGSLVNLPWLKRAYVPLVFSNFLQGGINVVDQSVATLLAPGSVSTLTLGTRLVSVVMAIGPTTLSTVILPKLCRIAASKDWKAMQLTVKRWLFVSFGVACLLSSVAILFSGPLAHLAFRSGSSNATDVNVLKTVQSLSFLQLPFVVVKIILVRVIVSLELNSRLVSVSLLALLANAVLDLCFVRLFGIGGITLSTAVVQAVIFLVLVRILRNLFATKAVLSRVA
jgi:putative peptidoglycan lipid II flippase